MRSLVFLVASFCACGGGLESKIEAAEREDAVQRARTERLRAESAALIADFQRVSASFEDAERRFLTAAQTFAQASADYALAADAFRAAERNWRLVTTALIVAASYDLAAGKVCGGIESTQQYRRRMGIVGDQSVCVDHSFAHALGGVNHAWNYEVIDCRLNASYSDGFWRKLFDMPVSVLRGLAVSGVARLACGSSPSAWSR